MITGDFPSSRLLEKITRDVTIAASVIVLGPIVCRFAKGLVPGLLAFGFTGLLLAAWFMGLIDGGLNLVILFGWPLLFAILWACFGALGQLTSHLWRG